MRKLATRVLRSQNFADAELSVSLVSDAEIRDLNREHLGRDRATNVISFPLTEGEFGGVNPGVLGDVVVSTDTARRQAEKSGNTTESETAYLLIHGILHLIGYDHERDKSGARAMRRLQDRLFEEHGGLLDP